MPTFPPVQEPNSPTVPIEFITDVGANAGVSVASRLAIQGKGLAGQAGFPQVADPLVGGLDPAQLLPGVISRVQNPANTGSVITVNDTLGNTTFAIGDISGFSWGGSAFTLPAGTLGIWGQRGRGVWLKEYIAVAYAVAQQQSFQTPTHTLVANTQYLSTVSVTLAMPFSQIAIPQGRICTVEIFPANVSVTVQSGTLNGSAQVGVPNFNAKRNGGAATTYAYLAGPTTPAADTYTNVSVVYPIQQSVTTDNSGNYQFTVNQLIVVRIFSHEVHQAPTVSTSFSQTLSSVLPTGGLNAGTGSETSSGAGVGTDTGGVQGDVGSGGRQA